MSYVRQAGASTARRRRRRRTAVTLGVLLLLLLGAFGYAVAYFEGWLPQDEADRSTGRPAPTTTTTTTAPPLPSPSEVTVNVYNATDRQGLAADTAAELSGRTFTVDAVANDPLDKTITGVAEIRHGQAGLEAARTVQTHLPDAELVVDDRGDATVDLALGNDFSGLPPPPADEGSTQPTTTSPPATTTNEESGNG